MSHFGRVLDAMRQHAAKHHPSLRSYFGPLKRGESVSYHNPKEYPAMMTFSEALEHLKKGDCVARAGWNGVRRMDHKYAPQGRTPVVHEGVTYVRLDDGSVAMCDESDYDLVVDKCWCIGHGGYAYYTRRNEDGSRSSVKMHQLIFPEWNMTDHRNGDRRDNRRFNLRPCTSQQNNANRGSSGRTSEYKGVSFDRSREVWVSSIQVNGYTKHLGRFTDEEAAAKAYDDAAVATHGEFAKLNFPSPCMFLYLVAGSHFKVNRPPLSDLYDEGTEVDYHAHIDMKMAQGYMVPWVASQADLLAEDWEVVT